MDTLKLTGLGKRYDGEYEFDIAELLGIGRPSMLDGDEAHLLKRDYGILVGQLEQALIAGDWDAMLGIAAVVLGRHEKQVTVAQLRKLPLSAVEFDFEPRRIELEDDADDPPAVTATETPPADGGPSGKPTSDPSANDPPPTGHPGSPRSVTSDPLTLVS